MKKRFIRFISLLVVMSMMLSISALAVGAVDSVYTFEYEGRTIEIDAGELTYEQANEIADKIVYGDSDVATYGILCIFGHKLEVTYAVETTHKAYATDPRCVRKTYKVEYCTRSSCSYSDATETSGFRISCCPEA